MMLIAGRRYDIGQPITLHIAGERLERLTSPETSSPSLPWIIPGLVDLQVNGYGGQEFSSLDLTPESVRAIVRQHFVFGVTALCPTLTTQGDNVFRHALRTIVEACRQWPEVEAAVAGIHLEGPYLSPEDGPRGAHPKEHCRPPNLSEFSEWQEAAEGRIRLLTLSPEYDEAPSFIEALAWQGVVTAIGHTAASGPQIRAAVDAGARLSTHLGNGAHRSLPRHPNYLWDQLAEDRLMASLIADGHHVPPEVLQSFLRAKTPARCILVSDVAGQAGLPPGRYTSSGCELEILSDGRLVIAGQSQLLAGASRPLHVGISQTMQAAQLPFAAAVDMASRQPAQLLNTRVGGFCPGDAADYSLVRRHSEEGTGPEKLEILATILQGQVVFGESAEEI